MIKRIRQSESGAAVLVAALLITGGILSIVLSLMHIFLNTKESFNSFSDSIQSFYAAESGVGESLMQLRRDHNNYTFPILSVDSIPVSSEFVEEEGACQPIPECQYVPDSGWWGEWFNYSVTHPDMEVNPYPGPTPTPTEHDWYDDIYKTHEQIDADLLFGSSWYPYDGTVWENMEGYNHDYHFGMHWRARVTAPIDGNYGFSLASDDDSWILVNGIVVVNNSGTHANTPEVGTLFLRAGDNIVEIYFAERHTVQSAMDFSFDDANLVITPWPEGCGEEVQCNSNIQATASTTNATRKVRYNCNQEIANCAWSELIP